MDSRKDMHAPDRSPMDNAGSTAGGPGMTMNNDQHELDPQNAFEKELRQAMQRVNAPETLERFLMIAAEAEAERERRSRRVLWFKPRTELGKRGGVLAFAQPQAWVGGAIAAVLVLGTMGSVEAIHLQNVRRQHEATRQFAQSEQIRDRALEHAREQMERAGVSLGE